MLNLTTAARLTAGTVLYCAEPSSFTKGRPYAVKVTSVTTWKTRPQEIRIGYKRGLKEYGTLHEGHLAYWTTDEAEALRHRPPLPAVVEVEMLAFLARLGLGGRATHEELEQARLAAVEAAYQGKSWQNAINRSLAASFLSAIVTPTTPAQKGGA